MFEDKKDCFDQMRSSNWLKELKWQIKFEYEHLLNLLVDDRAHVPGQPWVLDANLVANLIHHLQWLVQYWLGVRRGDAEAHSTGGERGGGEAGSDEAQTAVHGQANDGTKKWKDYKIKKPLKTWN